MALSVCEPRESMRSLPGWLQYPLTVFTGKPLAGQRPLVRWSPTFHLLTAVSSMAAGAGISALGWWLGSAWALLLLPGWAVTLHGMRNLRMMIYHQCSHRNLYRRRSLDAAIGRAISSLLVIQNFERYGREHVSDHHAAHHMTLRDPTVQAFLVTLQVHPGMSRREMWRTLLLKLASPRFHLAFCVARVRSFWKRSARSEKLGFAVLYGTAFTLAAATGHLLAFAVIWFVPLIPFFQISNTLRLCVKHTFPVAGVEERRGRDYFSSLTNAIFIGDPAPDDRRIASWAIWSLRAAFVHAPARYLVLTGDTVVHDFHHRHPASREWADYLFARERDLAAGHPGWPPYSEVWGLVPAISKVFDSIAAADPDEYDAGRVAEVSGRELFAAFDD